MKKIFLIVLLVMMIVSAISMVNFAQDITLRVSWYGSQDRHNRMSEVIKLFEEKYPNVKISPEPLGGDDYFTRIAVQTVAKNLPDVFVQGLTHIPRLLEQGTLLNLNPYIEDNTLNLDNTTEMEISGARINEKLYGVCGGTNSVVYFYDPELFKKAGVEEPFPDWTWEDYSEKCRKIHNALGIYGDDPYMLVRYAFSFRYYLTQHGKNLYDKSFKKLGYEDDSLFIDFYSMLVDLAKDGAIAPPELSLEIGVSPENTLLVKQDAAMWPAWSNQITALTAAAGRPLNMMIFPNSKDQVQYGTWIKGALYFLVPTYSKYPEWAVKFIDFYTNDLEANKILLAEIGLPISSKIREELKPYLTDAQKKMFNFSDLVLEYTSPAAWEGPVAASQIVDLLGKTYERMLFGDLTLEEAAKEFREKANKILAEN